MPFDDLFEIPTGTINGTNVTFLTSERIEDGLTVFINGIMYPSEDTIYGFSFTNGTSQGTITLTTAPLIDDDVLVYYNRM